MIALVIALLCLPHVLWVFYTAVMRLKMVRAAGQLTTAMKVFGYPVLFVGLFLDLAVNTLIGSIVFAELPHEFTLSSRLTRWSTNAAGGWRTKVALAIRMGLLDNIDPAGVHKG